MLTVQSLCELCDDREVAFWCEECRQWMCAQCKRSHTKIPATRDHDVTPLGVKVEQIKLDLSQQATSVRQRAATMTSHAEQALEKLDVKHAEFLKKSDGLRRKYIQQINHHFDTLNAEAINFIHEEAARVRNRKKEAEKSLEAVSSRLQTLEELLADNSLRLAVKGKKILEELATFQKTPFHVEVTITEPEICLSEAKPFNVRDVIIFKTVRGKTKLCRRDQDIYKFLSLREKRLVRWKSAKLVKSPWSVQCINDDIWACLSDGIIQIFDRDFKILRMLCDQQWDDVHDVSEMPIGHVVLAGRGGLYYLSATGETKTAIDKANKYNSSVIFEDKLFAYCWDPARLMVYTLQNDRWKKHDTISLAGVIADKTIVTLATANGKIFACSDDDAKVFMLSQSGEVLQTHGKPGSDQAGELRLPYLCAVDHEESMLVVDYYNDRLQVCDVTGQWSVLHLQPRVKKPLRAAVIDNKLYVCSEREKTLSVYASRN